MLSKPIYAAEYLSFGDFDAEALRRLMRELGRPRPRVAEIGSWLGQGSTRVLIEELARAGGGSLVCVDTWEGSPNVERHREIAEGFDVYETFLHNVRRAGGADLVEPMRMTSVAAAAILPDAAFDLVFIDGDHSLDATLADIAAWRPKVATGGILCGHDCELRATPENLLRLSAVASEDSIPGTGTRFSAVHPGVVLAVHRTFGSDARLWAERELVLPDGRRGPSTLWDVRA